MKIVIAERDTNSPFTATGAVIFEQHTHLSDLDVEEHARSIRSGGHYGRVWVADIDCDTIKEIHPDPEKLETNKTLTLKSE